VFPTRYRNEAEPLVILEAMQACCPVISFARGCIGEFIDTECGLLIPKDDAFVPAALERLSFWEAAPEEHAHARKAAYSKFLGARLRAEDAKKELIAILRLERPTGASS
jgi:glycosyltransferase involved in cell wall biosynthesis